MSGTAIMPVTLTSSADVVSNLRTLMTQRQVRIIGVEGMMQSGKSFLASTLAKALHVDVLHVDDFSFKALALNPGYELDDSQPYLRVIDLEAVRREFPRQGPTIVDGICLRDVLASANIDIEVAIYVRRVSSNGLWHDGYHLEDFLEDGAQPDLSALHVSELEYHARTMPHELADIIFERVGD